ncbi:hypothetical protein AM587_10001332 [Phytophthora nicotianae]|uniref:Uncharacterized protein n=3 Tax=Phytophthora nicotianae TaxID=4792 RepID=A0A0W8CN99_PHYNI|nr:hypothetical protein AM587_10001332 [Phytophthora nicotianae]
MSKVNKSKTLSLDEIKNIITRDIRLGSEHDNLSDTTVNLYTRQLIKLYKAGVAKQQWSPDEFISNIHYPMKYDDASFQKTFKVQNSSIIALLMSIYTSKESLILTLNAMCKMVKNRFRDAFGYYNAIRKELSKQNKAAKLDNELTPEEEKKYISYEELMSVPGKVHKVLTETYGKVFLSRSEFDELAKAKRTEYLKLVFDYITLWLNVHYPLRLVWPSVLLAPEEGANYLQGTFQSSKTMTLDSSGVGLMPLGTSSTNNLRFYGGTANRETMNIYRVSDTNGLVIASRTTSASNNKTYPLLNLISTDNPSSFVGGVSATSADLFNINWNDKPTVGFTSQTHRFCFNVGNGQPYKSGYPHTYTLATSADAFCINPAGSSPTPSSGCLYLVSDTVNKMLFNTNTPYSSSFGTAPVTLSSGNVYIKASNALNDGTANFDMPIFMESSTHRLLGSDYN